MNSRRKRSTKKILRKDRGSALLVSLMVIVGLSLLGLGFVTISETERVIARNEQSALQTQAIAEAGAKTVVEWFQSPQWGETSAAMPKNDGAVNANIDKIKVTRVIPGTNSYTGKYKPDANLHLFDKPYRGTNSDRFFGDESTADVIINSKTDITTLKAFNDILLGTTTGAKASILDKAQGEVTEIRVYAPPIVGGTLVTDNATAEMGNAAGKNADGTSRRFWSGGQRYGVATIKVTAQQFRDPNLPDATKYAATNVLTSHAVRLVVGEMPLPIPAGPIQGDANVSFGGAFKVHWGMETSTKTLDPSAKFTALPWANAYERPHFEHGYEPGTVQVWPTTAAVYDSQDFYHELLGREFQDIWYGARSCGDNLTDGTTPQDVTPQCYPYDYLSDEATNATPSWAFQWQDVNSYPSKKKVTFPLVLYDYWKRIAFQGRGYKGIYYFQFDKGAGAGYKKSGTGTTHDMAYWANITSEGANLGGGLYFFDTRNGRNPQQLTGAARTAELAPSESWSGANDFGKSFLMEGFVYMNIEQFASTGAGSSEVIVDANFPGEPYRDIGYPIWDEATQKWKDCAGFPCRSGVGDGQFSYQDLNKNGRFDAVIMDSPAYNWHDPGAIAGSSPYTIKTWKQDANLDAAYGNKDCTVPDKLYDGTNGIPTDCSEPHEPYLNIIWPTDKNGDISAANNCSSAGCSSSNGDPPDVLSKIGYEKPTAQTYWPKRSGVSCSKSSAIADCTSNSYDVDGPLVPIGVILYGILYNEGGYDAAGNAWYYGSLLIHDEIGGQGGANGTANVWFDEKLIKGSWAPPNMPRVIVFNETTDETGQ